MSYAKLYKREGFELLIDELTKGKKIIYDDSGYEAELKIESFDYYFNTNKYKMICDFVCYDEDGKTYIVDGNEYKKTWYFIND